MSHSTKTITAPTAWPNRDVIRVFAVTYLGIVVLVGDDGIPFETMKKRKRASTDSDVETHLGGTHKAIAPPVSTQTPPRTIAITSGLLPQDSSPHETILGKGRKQEKLGRGASAVNPRNNQPDFNRSTVDKTLHAHTPRKSYGSSSTLTTADAAPHNGIPMQSEPKSTPAISTHMAPNEKVTSSPYDTLYNAGNDEGQVCPLMCQVFLHQFKYNLPGVLQSVFSLWLSIWRPPVTLSTLNSDDWCNMLCFLVRNTIMGIGWFKITQDYCTCTSGTSQLFRSVWWPQPTRTVLDNQNHHWTIWQVVAMYVYNRKKLMRCALIFSWCFWSIAGSTRFLVHAQVQRHPTKNEAKITDNTGSLVARCYLEDLPPSKTSACMRVVLRRVSNNLFLDFARRIQPDDIKYFKHALQQSAGVIRKYAQKHVFAQWDTYTAWWVNFVYIYDQATVGGGCGLDGCGRRDKEACRCSSKALVAFQASTVNTGSHRLCATNLPNKPGHQIWSNTLVHDIVSYRKPVVWDNSHRYTFLKYAGQWMMSTKILPVKTWD